MNKPNIVFAFADDWGRYASVYAKHQKANNLNGLLDTPHFDRVAAEGALFLNAIVPAPSSWLSVSAFPSVHERNV